MLTDKGIKALKPKKSPYYESDNNDTKGKGRLLVQVLPSGTKSFKFRYYYNKKPIFISIGTYGSVSLVTAREISNKYSVWLNSGLNPKEVIAEKAKDKKKLEDEEKSTRFFETTFACPCSIQRKKR